MEIVVSDKLDDGIVAISENCLENNCINPTCHNLFFNITLLEVMIKINERYEVDRSVFKCIYFQYTQNH